MRGLLRLLVFAMLPTAMLAGPGLGQTISASGEADAVLAHGEELQKAGDLRGAIEAFQDVASTYPESREACAWAAVRASECLKSQGDLSMAFDTLRTVLAQYPDVPSACALAQCKVGEEYVRRAQLERAEEELLRVRASYPDEIDTCFWADLALADCLAFQGRTTDALSALDRVLSGAGGKADDVQIAWALFKKGSVLQSMKRSSEASDLLRHAAEDYGDLSRDLLFQCLVKLGEAEADDPETSYEHAVETLRWLLREFPEARRETAFAQYKIASLVEANAPDAASAIAEYRNTWERFPEESEPSAMALIAAARLSSARADYGQGEGLLTDAITWYGTRSARATQARLDLMEILRVRGRFPEAVAVADEILATPEPGLATSDEKSEALYRRARALESTGDDFGAAETYRLLASRAVTAPDSVDCRNKALFRLGNCLVRVGDFAGAERTYQQLQHANPDDRHWQARALLCMASASEQKGAHGEARAALQSLRDDYSDTRFARIAGWKLARLLP